MKTKIENYGTIAKTVHEAIENIDLNKVKTISVSDSTNYASHSITVDLKQLLGFAILSSLREMKVTGDNNDEGFSRGIAENLDTIEVQENKRLVEIHIERNAESTKAYNEMMVKAIDAFGSSH